MNTDDVQKTLQFLIELEKLKAVLRKNKPLGLSRYENSAEHSWQICLAAVALVPQSAPALDVAKVVEMLLVHDVPEIDIGDTIVYAAKSEDAADQERAAARRIFGLLPAHIGDRLFARWEEFETGATPESKFARALDRLMPALQNCRNHGQSWMENNIQLTQVLKKNEVIAQPMPMVWAQLRVEIENTFAQHAAHTP